jgi:hypothetical protein
MLLIGLLALFLVLLFFIVVLIDAPYNPGLRVHESTLPGPYRASDRTVDR